jgi:lipid II:glycine glycyltransferase (peptidoglycan interpeptide bridge formation enzyme)
MVCRVETKEIEEIEPTNIPTQTAFWGRLKNNQGFIPGGFQLTVSEDLLYPGKIGNIKIEEDILILVRYINRDQCYAYVPYGPKLQPGFENYGKFLEELSEVLRPHLPADCIFIKYDLPWENQWAREEDFFDHGGSWKGPPPTYTQELRLNINTNNWNLQKSPSDILPTNTIFLNLKLREKELLNAMRPKTRYNIRLSERKGVSVGEYGSEKIEEWYRLYSKTALRNNLTLHHRDYFSAILTNQRYLDENVRVSLLMADYEGEYLAAMFLILSQERGTYLYGASSSEKRYLMPSYAVQWEAIRKAREFGCTEYDMFGCAPNASSSHPLHGLYRYKRGFGGKLYHRMGCWDYPFLKDDYELVKAQEVNNQSYQV